MLKLLGRASPQGLVAVVAVAGVVAAAWASWGRFGGVRGFLLGDGFLTAVAALWYLVAFTSVRWRLLAVPIRQRSAARAKVLRAQVGSSDISDQAEKQILELVDRTETILASDATPVDRFQWSGADEYVAEHLLRHGEILLAVHRPTEQLDASLRLQLPALRRNPRNRTLAAAIDAALKAKDGENRERLQALLEHTLITMRRDAEERPNDRILTQHRKNFLLIVVGLGLAVVAAFLFGNAELLLTGAVGAFLSRLYGLLRQTSLSDEYRFTWTAMSLGPLFGALAAYGGILLVELLSKLNVLGAAFDGVTWDDPTQPATLAVAFLFGFSERLLDRVASAAERPMDAEDSPAAKGGPDEPDQPDEGQGDRGGPGRGPLGGDERDGPPLIASKRHGDEPEGRRPKR